MAGGRELEWGWSRPSTDDCITTARVSTDDYIPSDWAPPDDYIMFGVPMFLPTLSLPTYILGHSFILHQHIIVGLRPDLSLSVTQSIHVAKQDQVCMFLAVQDSSISDLVTQSVINSSFEFSTTITTMTKIMDRIRNSMTPTKQHRSIYNRKLLCVCL